MDRCFMVALEGVRIFYADQTEHLSLLSVF